MPLPTLHYHPLSSYCQKALIAAELLRPGFKYSPGRAGLAPRFFDPSAAAGDAGDA